jgi:peptide/nickel transport system permease protein
VGNRILFIGSLLLGILILIGLFGSYLPMVDRDLKEELYRLGDVQEYLVPPFAPSSSNWLGTDEKGRDLFSLIVMGTKETLLNVFVIVLIRYFIAVPIGIISAKQSGFIYRIQAAWHRFFSGLPSLFAVILLINLPIIFFSPQRTMLVLLTIALVEVGRVSYIIQQQTIGLSKETFVESGITIGNGEYGLFRRYYWPHLLPHILVNFSIDLGRVMLLIGQLGILTIFINEHWFMYDIGVLQVENASYSWPAILAESTEYFRTHFWIPFWPSVAIGLAVITFNMFGEGLRRYFNHNSLS